MDVPPFHVDADLKTRFDNLYVCDCSVIPEEWGLPPTMTLLGLGKRLAGHLLGETQINQDEGADMTAVKDTPGDEERAA